MNSKAFTQPDEQTVLRFIAGDEVAFEVVHAWLAPIVLPILAYKLLSQQDAEDVSQMIWETVWSRRTQFDGGNLRGWVFTIANSRVADFYRAKNRHGQAKQFSEDFEPERREESNVSSGDDERLAALRDCLGSIGGVFVDALVKRYLEGRTPLELAIDEGKKRGTIYTRLDRGRDDVKKCIEDKLGKVE